METNTLTPELREVLAAIELSADKPLSVLESETGQKGDAIEKNIDWLRDQKIIRRAAIFDSAALGYEDFVVFMTREQSASNPNSAKLADLLVRSKKTMWVARLNGAFDLCFSLRAAHASEVSTFFNDLFLGIDTKIPKKSIAVRTSITVYGRKFLSPKNISRTPIQFGGSREKMPLTSSERTLLEFLANPKDADGSSLPQDEHWRDALQKLKERQIVAGEIFFVDSEKLGTFHYKTLLTFNGLNSFDRNELFELCERHPNICYLAECLGGFDFEVGIEVERRESAESVNDDLRAAFGRDGINLETMEVPEYLKHSFFSF